MECTQQQVERHLLGLIFWEELLATCKGMRMCLTSYVMQSILKTVFIIEDQGSIRA